MKTPIERAVDAAGSQAELAKALNVSPQRVWNWVNRDSEIPAEQVLPIERATGIPRHELRPDIFEPPAETAEARA